MSRPLAELQDEGLLWLINRVVFHPRGCALALEEDETGAVIGWDMLGDGTEVWTFMAEDDDECFAKATAFFDALRACSTESEAER
jgi:hypothetical protein